MIDTLQHVSHVECVHSGSLPNLRYGAGRWELVGTWEKRKKGGDIYQGVYMPRVDCGLSCKHQRSLCDICITHVHGGVAAKSSHYPAKPKQGLQVVSHWTMNNALNEIVLTCQYVENAPMEVWGQRGRQRGRQQG